MTDATSDDSDSNPPPPSSTSLVRSAMRESLVVTGIWLVAATWTLTVCYFRGYNRDVNSIRFILGIPDWVFWGIVVPWIICAAVSCVFGAFFVRDSELGESVSDDDGLGLGG